MDTLYSLIDFLQSEPMVGVFAALFALSEALAAIPALQANSVLQVVGGILKRLAGDKVPAEKKPDEPTS